MKAEGWQDERDATDEDILNVANVMFHHGCWKDLILRLKRALYRDPANIEIEEAIEEAEAKPPNLILLPHLFF